MRLLFFLLYYAVALTLGFLLRGRFDAWMYRQPHMQRALVRYASEVVYVVENGADVVDPPPLTVDAPAVSPVLVKGPLGRFVRAEAVERYAEPEPVTADSLPPGDGGLAAAQEDPGLESPSSVVVPSKPPSLTPEDRARILGADRAPAHAPAPSPAESPTPSAGAPARRAAATGGPPSGDRSAEPRSTVPELGPAPGYDPSVSGEAAPAADRAGSEPSPSAEVADAPPARTAPESVGAGSARGGLDLDLLPSSGRSSADEAAPSAERQGPSASAAVPEPAAAEGAAATEPAPSARSPVAQVRSAAPRLPPRPGAAAVAPPPAAWAGD